MRSHQRALENDVPVGCGRSAFSSSHNHFIPLLLHVFLLIIPFFPFLYFKKLTQRFCLSTRTFLIAPTYCGLFRLEVSVVLIVHHITVCFGLYLFTCWFQWLTLEICDPHISFFFFFLQGLTQYFAHSKCSINTGWIKLCSTLKMTKHKMYLCSPPCKCYSQPLGKCLLEHLFSFFNEFWSYIAFKCLGDTKDKYILM